MKASIAKVRLSLPEEKRKEFDQSIREIDHRAMSPMPISQATISSFGIAFTLKNVINGKTGSEVIAVARKIKKKQDNSG
jgi:hypothetical protein